MAGTRVIKKYANRKLYDMQDRKYVTVAAVQNMINAGLELVVVDKETEADITESVVSGTPRTSSLPSTAAPRSTSRPSRPRLSRPSVPSRAALTGTPVRHQVANLLRSSINLPLELGQIARDRMQPTDRGVSQVSFERLAARVAELEADVALLREVLSNETSVTVVKN